MCGIFGYLGKRTAAPILIEGLRRLEYRGYDSAGLAVLDTDKILVVKTVGHVAELDKKLQSSFLSGTAGVAHTRWATHGVPSEVNAHPHLDNEGKIAVVHNGIISNADALRAYLTKEGAIFRSQTDTEVIPHLVAKLGHGDVLRGVEEAIRVLEGTFGIAVISASERRIVAARRGSPLVLGVGDGEYFLASDPTALGPYTRKVVYLNDGDLLVIDDDGYRIQDSSKKPVEREAQAITWSVQDIEKGSHGHFMHKEIWEQAKAVQNALRGRCLSGEGRVSFGDLGISDRDIRMMRGITMASCGTSWHAALIAEHFFQHFAELPTRVEYASEMIFKNLHVTRDDLFIAISQSGETADTLSSLRYWKERGGRTIGIVNAEGSTIAREAGYGAYMHVGPEIGVASTKAFAGELVVLYLLAVHFGRVRGVLDQETAKKLLLDIESVPEKIDMALKEEFSVRAAAEATYKRPSFLFLGCGINYPIALEGALKLKEISYIHAEGMPAAELKHGPLALVDEKMPALFIAQPGPGFERTRGNIREILARKGDVILLTSSGDSDLRKLSNKILTVPGVSPMVSPLVNVVPLQLLAYHAAVLKKCDVDKPRNLAKSVTVE